MNKHFVKQWQLFVEYLEMLFHSLRKIVNSIKTVVKSLISIFVGNSYEKLKRFVKYIDLTKKILLCRIFELLIKLRFGSECHDFQSFKPKND